MKKQGLAFITLMMLFLSLLHMNSVTSFYMSDDEGQIQITNNDYNQSYPRIFENYIVWAEYPHDYVEEYSLQSDNKSIFLFNLETKEKKLITSGNRTGGILGLQNDIVYYSEYVYYSLSYNEIWIYKYTISENRSELEYHVRNRSRMILSDNYIYSQSNSWPNSTIYEYNVANDQERVLINHLHRKRFIGGNDRYLALVYVPKQPCLYNLFVFDKENEKEKMITQNYSTNDDVEIDGSYMLFNDENRLWLYSFITKQYKLLGEGIYDYKIHNNTIICIDHIERYPTNAHFFRAIDIESGNEYNFTTFNISRFSSISSSAFDIFNKRVVWSDNWDPKASYEIGDFDNIFYFDLSEKLESKDQDIESKSEDTHFLSLIALVIIQSIFSFIMFGVVKKRKRIK